MLDQEKGRTDEIVGKIVDNLKMVDHFCMLNNQLGSDYLIAMIPLIKPFILRKGFGLMN